MKVNNTFINEIKFIISQAQEKAIRSINFERVLMYWKIGERIVNEEQSGELRAEYGQAIIKNLSLELQPEFGSGFSNRNLELMRRFYINFPISQTVSAKFSWSHYVLFISVEDIDKRKFYIAESDKNNWSVRQLERQINSQLYERLLLSNDKKSVLAIANKDELPDNPKQIIKDPMVLEFLSLKKEASYYEKDLEQAIITHLHDFLLELGNGFSFVARQKRIHLDGDDFFIDLVFYNRLLQCFVLIEIKTHKLTHQDIGQLQMYVNYYDRIEKQDYEKASIGILLCAQKNDAMVQFALPKENKTILASKYQLYLPTEKQLLAELKKELDK